MRGRLTVTRCVALLALLAAVLLPSCDRHDVGTEATNPAPSSGLTLAQAEVVGVQWYTSDPTHRSYGVPAATSSMVPVLDSHSVLLLELVTGPVRLHDILILNEGPGRENVCHRVTDLRAGYAYIDGANNTWPDGWMPLSAVKWRVAGIIYSKG